MWTPTLNRAPHRSRARILDQVRYKICPTILQDQWHKVYEDRLIEFIANIFCRTNYTGAMTTLVVGVVLITIIVIVIAMHKRGKLEDLL